jgi:CheY-like chemotaxis protein
VLKNLLSNAFKFTEKGSVTLKIMGAQNGMIAFAVTDTGIGIPQDKQMLIFEAFQQADGTTSRRYGGTGLGLTISREIARLLGGQIEVQSVPGSGSTFTLFLPEVYAGGSNIAKRADEREAAVAVPPLPADANFQDRKILIVDDDSRNIYAISSVLESRGMKVFHSENGQKGIEKLRENPEIDLVLMDTMMPEMDGLTATGQIRLLPQFRALPIISLTAKAMKGDREKCLRAGASDYITKPVDIDNLLSLIHIWLKKKRPTELVS